MDVKKINPYESLTAIITVLAIVYWLTEMEGFLYALILVGLLGSLFKNLAGFIHLGWMQIARGINFIVSNLILSVVFYLILTPIAILYRIFNKKNLMTHTGEDTHYHTINKEYQKNELANPW